VTTIKRFLPYVLLLAVLLAQRCVCAGRRCAPRLRANSGLTIDLNGSGMFTDRMLQMVALVTVLSIAPSILIMMTSFVRIVVVLSLLRTALGLQQSPPNSVIISLSLFLSLFVMTPTLTDAYNQGIRPMINNTVTAEVGFTQALVPMKKFMLEHVRAADLKLFSDMAKTPATNDPCADRGDHAGPRLHAVGAQARLRDRVSDFRAISDHRHGGRLDPDEHGHDDAATRDHLPALQIDLLRAGGWLAAYRRFAGAELHELAPTHLTRALTRSKRIAAGVYSG
jgi:flagellar biosynthesis protein FliP